MPYVVHCLVYFVQVGGSGVVEMMEAEINKLSERLPIMQVIAAAGPRTLKQLSHTYTLPKGPLVKHKLQNVVRRLGLGICPSTSHSHSYTPTVTCTCYGEIKGTQDLEIYSHAGSQILSHIPFR